MPAHHSQARKLHRAAMQHKTRFCRAFLAEGACANGASCPFAHGAEELQSSSLAKDTASNCFNADDSTSVCSEDMSLSSVCSTADTASLCGVSHLSARQNWADVDDDDDDEWRSMWAPPSQPKMHELSIASHLLSKPAEVSKAALKAMRREQAAAAAQAKRAMLTGAVLEGLLRLAQSPDVYQD